MNIVTKLDKAFGSHPLYKSSHDIGYAGEIEVYHKEASAEETDAFLTDCERLLTVKRDKTHPQGNGILMTRFWMPF